MAQLSETRELAFSVQYVSHGANVGLPCWVARGKYNFALCDQEGFVIRTFVPETDHLPDIMECLKGYQAGTDALDYTGKDV